MNEFVPTPLWPCLSETARKTGSAPKMRGSSSSGRRSGASGRCCSCLAGAGAQRIRPSSNENV